MSADFEWSFILTLPVAADAANRICNFTNMFINCSLCITQGNKLRSREQRHKELWNAQSWNKVGPCFHISVSSNCCQHLNKKKKMHFREREGVVVAWGGVLSIRFENAHTQTQARTHTSCWGLSVLSENAVVCQVCLEASSPVWIIAAPVSHTAGSRNLSTPSSNI